MTDRSAISNDATREEEKAREEEALRKKKEEKQLDILNDPLIVEYTRFKHEIDEWRRNTVNFLPSFFINNSSNALGAMHIAGEVLMLKSTNIQYMTTEPNGRQWHHYLTEPPKSVFDAVFGKSVFKRTEPTLLKEVQSFFDVDKASKKDWEEAVAAVKDKKKPDGTLLKPNLVNRWQTRATGLGILGWGLSAVLPENKEDPEEIERMTRMSKEDPLGYVGARLWQAVDFTHWSDNKAQMTGGSVLIGGMCSTLGAWRGIAKEGAIQSYYPNRAYAFQGCLTILAGAAALLGVTKEDSYRNFGTVMMGKIPLLPANIAKRFTIKETGRIDENRWYYVGAHSFYQTQNMTSFLIGGVQKAEDGTILDQKAIREEAKHKVLEERQKRKENYGSERRETSPALLVSKPEHCSRVSDEQLVQRDYA